MGRYDVGKESTEGAPGPASTQPRNPNVVPTEVKFEINAEDSLWYIKIMKEDKETETKWEFLKKR
jgi:hypothetical protein